jgi:translation elongation factor EF-G
MRKLSLGILAHADAGKTTLSEALLYLTSCSARMVQAILFHGMK